MKRFNKSLLALTTATLFVLAGCFGNGVETAASKDVKHITPVLPYIELGTPSESAMRSIDSATILVTITDAIDSTLSAADIGSISTGDALCTIGVTNLTDTTARITLSTCTGDGTFQVNVKQGVVVSTTNTPNDASSNSSQITIDNTSPTVTSFTPATGPVASIPTTLVLTFSEPVEPTDVVTGNFTIDAVGVAGGACQTPPAFVSRVMSVGNTVATVTLSAATCDDTEGARIRLAMGSVDDSVGNAGTVTAAATRTYTFSDGPTVDFDPAWASVIVNSGTANTIDVDFQAGNTNVVLPTINTASVGVVATGTADCDNPTGTGVTTNGATINLANCTGNGTIAVNIQPGILETASGIPNVLSADSATFEVDNLAPALTSLTPATSTINALPTVRAVYNDSMTVATVTSGDVVISASTCAVLPAVDTITPSVTDTTFDITFTGTCTTGQSFTVSMNGTTSTDAAGNAGSASAFSRTYTFDTTAPTLVSFIPASATVAAMPAILEATFSKALNTGTMTAGDFVQTGTCGTPPTVGAPMFSGGDTVATSALSGGTCANGQTLIYTVTPGNVTDTVGNAGSGGAVARTFLFDTAGPTVSAFTPATARVNAMPANLEVTFDEAIDTATMTAADFAQSGDCMTPPTVGAAGYSVGDTVATSTLTGGTCNDGETLTYTVNAAGVDDVLGNAGSGSTVRTFTFDTTAPTVIVTGVNATNATVTATFSEPVSTMSMVKFQISGCSVNPIATNFIADGTEENFTIDLDDSGATCLSAETLTVTVDAADIVDKAGNTGAGTDSDSFLIP